MKTDWLIGEELAALLQAKNAVCVSVILPTHALSPERRMDSLQVQRALTKAREYLYSSYSPAVVKPLLTSLDAGYKAIDFTRNREGIGLFVSEHIKQSVSFYFPVKEQVLVSDSFAIRDWLYQIGYARRYLVLLLNEQEARLYQGLFDELEEVQDQHFPMPCTDDYEYNEPSRGSSYLGQAVVQQFEKDKSHINELRLQQCLRRVDEALDSYMVGDTLLLVTGAGEDIHLFESVSKHAVAATLPGNYFYLPVPELAWRSWKAICEVLEEEKRKALRAFRESPRQNTVTGIYEIWKAVHEGRGWKLLVEKDFELAGYFAAGDDSSVYLHPPLEPHTAVTDVVEHIIRHMVQHKGEVIFVENGSLASWQKMVLITRY